jgi:hypothetical protein
MSSAPNTYDQSGNPPKIADTSSTGPAGVQCLQHDHHRRITEAWTQNHAGCAATPSSGTIGGVASYWQSHSYDQAGNRTAHVDHGIVDRGCHGPCAYPAAGERLVGEPLNSSTWPRASRNAYQAGSRCGYSSCNSSLNRRKAATARTLICPQPRRSTSPVPISQSDQAV